MKARSRPGLLGIERRPEVPIDRRGSIEEMKERARLADPLADSATLALSAQRAWLGANGLGPVSYLLEDPAITEIMINGPGEIWVDRDGHTEPSGESIDGRQLALLIERIVDPLGLQVDRSSPLVDARLDDGSRVHIVVPPLALAGPVVTIRRFSDRVLPLSAFGRADLVRRLRRIMSERRTVLVIGGTASGKTSLLNALGSTFDPNERVITIEDTAELRLPGRHVVGLEARPANREGVGEVSLRSLVRTALRMRPDRIIVGEVRGPEALDLLLAQSSGHRGSLATFHADSPLGALGRLEILALLGESNLPPRAVRALIHSALDVIVQVERIGSHRLVTEIAELGPGPTEPPRTLWASRPTGIAS